MFCRSRKYPYPSHGRDFSKTRTHQEIGIPSMGMDCTLFSSVSHLIFFKFFFNFSFVKAVGVCFLAVCEGTYPAVLVFCFLEELQREFTVVFQSHDVQKAKRPYSFIEFGEYSVLILVLIC